MLVGVAIVRNEDDVIATTIRHHLALGLDAILISDNESDDDTLKIIRRMAATDRRIRWSRSRGFRQQEIVNELANEARRLGAEWILPFDADEFWLRREPWLPLLLEVPHQAAFVLANVVNFVQRRDQLHRDPRGLLGAVYRSAQTIGTVEEAPQLVGDGAISYVEAPFGMKGIFRASVKSQIVAGGHRLSDNLPYVETKGVVCLHLPLRSRDTLDGRVEQSRRLTAAGLPSHHGWQQRHFARQADNGEIDKEWAANSVDDQGFIAARRGPVALLRDTTLAGVVRPSLAD